MRSLLASLVGAGAFFTVVSAHGYVGTATVDGTAYAGFDPDVDLYTTPVPASVGWYAQNGDHGYVAPDAYTTSDIACHKQSKAAAKYVSVAAGGTVDLAWNTWPDSHHGPILNYLAACDDCTTAAPGDLSFVKISQDGIVSGSNPGTWATDTLISNNFTYSVKIPSSLAAGNYVLRHEIIALHSAGNTDGAQSYPQCVNLQVTGSGTATPSGGVPATSFYTETDPGIKFNLYTSFTSYPFPGPELWTAANQRRHSREWFVEA